MLSDKNLMLFHTAAGENRKSYLFANPVRTIICNNPKFLKKALLEIDKAAAEGFYTAGYITYDAGCYMQLKSGIKIKKSKTPLLKFGVYNKPRVFKNLNLKPSPVIISKLKSNIIFNEYAQKFDEIKQLIQEGEAYQVNMCFKMNFEINGLVDSLFASLCEKQAIKYAALIKDGKNCVMSFSPELFFEIKGRSIKMRPMKGTLLKPCKAENLKTFKNDPKTSAENIMIVDLIRNDLGKICVVNSIKADKLFEVEEYKTLYQMTSTVSGTLKTNTSFTDIIEGLFPSGSVTGAPKIRAMQIINQMEKNSRGIYTGAIGFIMPYMRKAVFSIPIRTAVINGNHGSYGIGSGIVNDSTKIDEYNECIGKASILEHDFKIIESLLFQDGKYFLKESHIKRMNKSADTFNFLFIKSKVEKILKRHGAGLKKRGLYKVRLLLSYDGSMTIESKEIKPGKKSISKTAISKVQTDSKNIFLRHKTTNREMYDAEFDKYQKIGFDDVIFFNKQGQLTEAHSSNVFVEKNGVFYTPPVKCGLLPGTYRGYLLSKGSKYREKILYKKDMINGDAVYICNSVRGLKQVILP